jgi:hypothetical protein
MLQEQLLAFDHEFILQAFDQLSEYTLAALRFAARRPAAQGRVVCLPNPALSPSVRKRTSGACWAILTTRLTALTFV